MSTFAVEVTRLPSGLSRPDLEKLLRQHMRGLMPERIDHLDRRDLRDHRRLGQMGRNWQDDAADLRGGTCAGLLVFLLMLFRR